MNTTPSNGNGDGNAGGKVRRPDDPHGFRARRERLGLSQHELARRAGIDFQRVQFLERSTPSGRPSFSKYMPLVENVLAEVEGLVPTPTNKSAPPIAGRVPIYALRLNAQSRRLEMTGGVSQLGTVARPDVVEFVHDAFAVEVRLNDMAPRWRPGDILVLNPLRAPRVTAGVMLLSDATDEVDLGEFVSEAGDVWTLQKYGETPAQITVERARFPLIATVVALFPG